MTPRCLYVTRDGEPPIYLRFTDTITDLHVEGDELIVVTESTMAAIPLASLREA